MADTSPTTGDRVETRATTADDLERLVTTSLVAPSDALLPLGPVTRKRSPSPCNGVGRVP